LFVACVLAPSLGNITPEECEDAEFHLDPDNCPHSYYRCYHSAGGGWTVEQHDCPPGTDFNPAINNCDWSDNVPDNVCDGVTHKPPTGPVEETTTMRPTDPATTTTEDSNPETTTVDNSETTTPEEPTMPATTTTRKPVEKKRLVCYFGAWAFYRPGDGKFDIDNIDPHLCTHLCYGFANMNNATWEAVSYDPWYDLAPWDEGCDGDHCHYDSFRRFNALKQKNSELKTLLSIGGWNTGSGQWSIMAADPQKRSTFIQSAVAMASKFGFNGIDFDWEYPGDRPGSDPEHDREDFTILAEELGAALHAKGLILSAAVSPDPDRAEIGYDVPRVFAAMDFVNVMDYDYHGAWDNFTGHNTPLYSRNDEGETGHPQFNVNDTLNYYLGHGAPREKINLGTAAYGRGFTLPSPSSDSGLYCPTKGPFPAGVWTREPGMLAYSEILQLFNNDTLFNMPDATPKDWADTVDGCYKAPYSVNGPYWIGYDNPDSIALKVQMANTIELGGAMMFALDLDDFRGTYGEAYPLTRRVKSVLESGEGLAPENILGENSGCESAPSCL